MDKVSFKAITYTKEFNIVPLAQKRILNSAAGELPIARQIQALEDLGLDIVLFHRAEDAKNVVRARIQYNDSSNILHKNIQGAYAEGIASGPDSAKEFLQNILTEGFIKVAEAVKRFRHFE